MLTKLNRLSPGRPRHTRKLSQENREEDSTRHSGSNKHAGLSHGSILKVMTDRCSSLSPLPYWRTNGEEQEPSYYRARYYDSNSGRFISEDPLRFDDGWANLYLYVTNRPAGLVDSFGLSPNP